VKRRATLPLTALQMKEYLHSQYRLERDDWMTRERAVWWGGSKEQTKWELKT